MSDAAHGSGLREHMLLFSRFLRNPRSVGALSPSSQTVARVIADGLPAGDQRRIVELGPGTGALTGELMRRLRPGDRFLAIDVDAAFVKELQARWPALESVCGSAADLARIATERGMPEVDHIVSGLPFATIPVEVTQQILASVMQTLRPGGRFTTFQYLLGYPMPSSVAFRRQMSALLGARPVRQLVMQNLPPCFVVTWIRPGRE
ncbi:MAG TPA: methyltransferase domain-containing protein [Vicinamibacterales bacterium]|nr:methyltransferase domain-containing protein [Vicinamibacterales bacterium]